MCLCEKNFLFLGSRLGNSLLLKITEKESATEKLPTIIIDLSKEPQPKKKRLDTLGNKDIKVFFFLFPGIILHYT